MSASLVSIAINARNLAGGAFAQLQRQSQTTGGFLNRLRGNFQGVTNAADVYRDTQGRLRNEQGRFVSQGASASGQILGLSSSFLQLSAVIGVVTLAYAKLQAASNEAAQRQLEQVSAVATATKTLGLNVAQAQRYVQGVNQDISKLGKDLPTSAENINVFFRSIQDDYNLALKKSGATVDQIKQVQIGDSSRIALLSDLSGGDIGASRSAISAYLSGSVGPGGLDQYQFFGNNPLLLSGLKEGLQKTGSKSFGDLSSFQRIKLLSQALDKAITPQDIQLLQGTVKAKISSVMDTLFDPEIGLFSISRDLEPKIDGYQSVFEAFGQTLDILVGNNGIFSNIARLLGLNNSDPMRVIYDGLNAFNAYLVGIAGGLTKLKTLTGTQIGAGVGKFLAQATNVVFDGLLGALTSINYKGLIKGVFAGVGSFFANLDWKVYAAAAIGVAATAIAPFIIGALWTLAAGLISAVAGALIGVPVLLLGAIGLGIVAIGKLISDNWDKIATFISTQWTKLTKTVGEIIDGVSKTIFDFFGMIQEKIAGITQSLSTPNPKITAGNTSIETPATYSGLKNIGGGLLNFIGGFFSRADGFLPASSGLLGALATEASRKPVGSDFVIANTSEAILTPQMMRNLNSNLQSGSSKTINIQPGAFQLILPSGTPREIAEQAIQMIEERLFKELDTKIA